MKHRQIVVFILVFLFTCLALTSCRDEVPETCVSHTDADENGKCDACDTDVQTPKDEPCEECADSDGDGLCDSCGETVFVEPPAQAPECEHTDKNYDGKCDSCKSNMENALFLVDKGKTEFSFVVPWGISGETLMAIDRLASELKNLKVDIEVVDDEQTNATEYEILFGDIKSRGEEYKKDGHKYGKKGYAIEIVGKKILVLGGSEESLVTAIAELRSRFFGITEKTVRLINRVVYPEQCFEVVQNDYKVTALTLYGDDLRNYSIAIDDKASQSIDAANQLRDLLYDKTGYWLPIVSVSEAHKAIYLMKTENTGGEGFYVSFAENRIEISSEYYPSLSKETCKLFSEILDNGEGTVNLTSEANFIKDVRYVYYDDFGALGDGVTNDAAALLAAHIYANSGGYKRVVATSGKTYYIGNVESEIPIMCDVDWTGAKFIIDDTASDHLGIVFNVTQNASGRSFNMNNSDIVKAINEAGGIDKESFTKLDLGLGYLAMLKINNSSHKQFIRYGPNASGGVYQTDIILVDAEGNVDSTTPLLFDFAKVTSIIAYRRDVSPLTITGGEFTTIANQREINSTYSNRGIYVSRSNVTVDGLEHYIVGEGEKGAAYSFFLGIGMACDVTVSNSVFSAHKTYYLKNGIGIGSYDLNVDKSVNVTFKNCTQVNMFDENGNLVSGKWGIMASGESKNLTYDGCILSRFDAHEGVVNVKLKDSTLRDISVVGGGTLEIENCHIYKVIVVELRSDYGSFWHGDIILKDVTVHTDSTPALLSGSWVNHDFGYPTAMPTNIVVDNLKIVGNATKVAVLSSDFNTALDGAIVDEFTSTNSLGETVTTPNVNKTLQTEAITIKNNEQGLAYFFPNSPFFNDTEVTVIEP